MRPQFESLKSDAESLPDGPDKQAMLDMLAQASALDKQFTGDSERFRSRQRHQRIVELLVGLLLCGVAAYFSISGVWAGKVRNVFLKDIPYTYWDRDPYVFLFLVAFYGVFAISFFCVAIGITRFGRATKMVSAGLERALQEEKVSEAKLNHQSAIEIFFGLRTNRINIPLWFAVLVIALIVGAIIHGSGKGV